MSGKVMSSDNEKQHLTARFIAAYDRLVYLGAKCCLKVVSDHFDLTDRMMLIYRAGTSPPREHLVSTLEIMAQEQEGVFRGVLGPSWDPDRAAAKRQAVPARAPSPASPASAPLAPPPSIVLSGKQEKAADRDRGMRLWVEPPSNLTPPHGINKEKLIRANKQTIDWAQRATGFALALEEEGKETGPGDPYDLLIIAVSWGIDTRPRGLIRGKETCAHVAIDIITRRFRTVAIRNQIPPSDKWK